MPTFQNHKIHFLSGNGFLLGPSKLPSGGPMRCMIISEILPFKWQSVLFYIQWQNLNLTSLKLNKKKPMKATNFFWGKIALFFSPTFWIQDLSMATTTHPPTFPLLDHHLFCTSVWILFRFGVTVLPWEIVGGFNKTLRFFPCGEKTPGHQNWPYLSTGMKGTIRFLWLLYHQFSVLTWFTG